ncbi:hypothetical protein [Bryobacter aggregatus]|uniref:hypothetical protein n=1 Tax=Bryobacter aggregatus TaxID=360054 RepID=UPI0004E10373|nr:hypothetical protein [Bryobacter aggregatus]
MYSQYSHKGGTKHRWIGYLALALFATQLQAQVLDANFLSGRYGFRQVLVSTNTAGQPIESRSLVGVFSFDGKGSFSYQATRNLGNSAPNQSSGSGTYTVAPNGFVSMTNPLDANSRLNLRLGNGILLGGTTESSGNVFDLMIAVQLPALAASNATINGSYVGTSIEFPNGIFFNIKNSFFRFTSGGQGTIGLVNSSGQAVQSGKRVQQQAIGPTIYSLNNDSSGLLVFPVTAPYTSSAQLLLGDKQIYASAGGEFIIGGSTSQGAHDIFFAMKTVAAPVSNANFKGLYFGASLKVDQSRPSNFVGAANALGTGQAVWSRRVRLPEGIVDATALNNYSIGNDGVGTLSNNRFALSSSGNVFLASGTSVAESDNYELMVGVKARDLTGSGIFLNPAGVLNAASFAPVGNPIAPGQFLSLFGTGLGPAAPVLATAPFPKALAGVSVTIQDRPAPIYFVSAYQMSVLVPFATSGTTAEVVVKIGDQESNRVTVPVARTAPGVYSLSQNGIGAGAILKSDYSLVTASNPANRNDVVQVYLTGLGELNPALVDGAPASTSTLSRVTDTVNAYVGGVKAVVTFAGAAPGFAGLYQMNIVIPAAAPSGSAVPLAIETSSSFHDMVDIAIHP